MGGKRYNELCVEGGGWGGGWGYTDYQLAQTLVHYKLGRQNPVLKSLYRSAVFSRVSAHLRVSAHPPF